MPLLYYTGKIDQLEEQSQRNMGRFMKILLVKRLESSFYAFRNSVDRFLQSYEMFIREFDRGNVYVSKKYIYKIFEMLENGDDEAVQRLIDEGRADKYKSEDFREELRMDLQHDHAVLMEIKRLWQDVRRDPKLLKFTAELSNNGALKDNRLIIFTESKETADYLFKHLNEEYPAGVLLFTGDSGESVRDKVLENFDARARNKKDQYRILVSTEVLSEGVNLHRANVVVNYDIPWNPTRMMQRVGRINRIDTSFDVIQTDWDRLGPTGDGAYKTDWGRCEDRLGTVRKNVKILLVFYYNRPINTFPIAPKFTSHPAVLPVLREYFNTSMHYTPTGDGG